MSNRSATGAICEVADASLEALGKNTVVDATPIFFNGINGCPYAGQGQGQGRIEEDHCCPGLDVQANQRGPCSEFEKKDRKCLHTLVVTLALWQEEGMRDEGLGVGQVDVDGGRIPDGTPRTAQKMLDKDAPACRKGLANCLNTMSVYKFPENLPFGLGRHGAITNANASITCTTSQNTCSGCGRDFPAENQHTVVATRLTEGPGMSKVNVHTNECETCGIHGLASENWRETGLFNYNNSYLVELSILYRCLEAFTRGTTISAFFETFLEPLASDLVWIKANPDLSNRLANGTNLLNVLNNIFLAFLALIDHTFEFRCWMWVKFPPILTFDACMKIACNFVTLGQRTKRRFLGCTMPDAKRWRTWKNTSRGSFKTAGDPLGLATPGGGASIDTEDGEPAPTPRVFFPALAHLGSHSSSTTVEAPQVSVPVPPKRDSKVDVYALKAAAQGDRVQSQVNVYDLLHASAETQGPVPKAVNLAATRAVAGLREAGVRVLSLFEVLIFTYVWLRNIAEDEPGMLELGATGWTLRRPSHGVLPVGTTAESVDAISTGDAEKHLREVLVVARGATNGKGACMLAGLVWCGGFRGR
ncbi:unnamed protein product [Ectocarpus sp. CCAP 1310/34]|nr:unnamed protein product [Ectocarpus sp. CCAP 1310/34]